MPSEPESNNNPYGDDVHIVKYEGEAREFHCMDCARVCNYLNECYCCDQAMLLADKVKKFKGHFLKMCFRRNEIDLAIKAMEQGKRLVKQDGKCFHCRTTKQHEEGWCKSKTNVQLLKHFILKEEIAIEKNLEKYLELRKTVHVEDYELESRRQASLIEYDTNPKLAKYQRNRAIRMAMKEKESMKDAENERARKGFHNLLKQKRDAAIKSLEKIDLKNLN